MSGKANTLSAAAVTEILPLSFSLEQGRLLMGALAELPFRRVFELIGKLNANAQALTAHDASLRVTLSPAELVLALEALGLLPYVQVHVLIASLQAQLQSMQRLQDGADRKASRTGPTGKVRRSPGSGRPR